MGCPQCKGQRLKSDVSIPITVERVAFLFRIYRVPGLNFVQTAYSDPGRLYLRTCSIQIAVYSFRVLHAFYLPNPFWCTADSSFCHSMLFSLELLKCWKMKRIFLKSLEIRKISHKQISPTSMMDVFNILICTWMAWAQTLSVRRSMISI